MMAQRIVELQNRQISRETPLIYLAQHPSSFLWHHRVLAYSGLAQIREVVLCRPVLPYGPFRYPAPSGLIAPIR